MLQLQFVPTAPGLHSGTLQFASNAGSLSVGLAGEGRAAPATSPSTSVGSSGTPVNSGGGGSLDASAVLLLLLALLNTGRRRFQ